MHFVKNLRALWVDRDSSSLTPADKNLMVISKECQTGLLEIKNLIKANLYQAFLQSMIPSLLGTRNRFVKTLFQGLEVEIVSGWLK